MRWSSRLGDPQAGLPLVHHSGGLNFAEGRLVADRWSLHEGADPRSPKEAIHGGL